MSRGLSYGPIASLSFSLATTAAHGCYLNFSEAACSVFISIPVGCIFSFAHCLSSPQLYAASILSRPSFSTTQYCTSLSISPSAWQPSGST